MVDLDLKYCPQCNDEYRAEIEKCAVCGVDLLTGAQKIAMEEERRKKLEKRTAELSPDDDLVALRRGPLTEMRHLAALLDGENIGTLLVGDEKTCGQSCCPSVYNLLVKREDGMEAFNIIEEEHKRTTGLTYHEHPDADIVFNPEAGEACCPACGHRFPTTGTTCPDCGLNFG
jgi:hypothetical protein